MYDRKKRGHPCRLNPYLLRSRSCLLVGLFALVSSACQAPTTRLRPAASAEQTSPMDMAASAETRGVFITVDADAWQGERQVWEHVTPLLVDIENDSDQPLRIRYSDFALLGDDSGRRFAALPPYAIDGTISERVVARYDSPVDPIGFRYDRFYVSPFYNGVYPNMRYWRRPFYSDPDYYNHYFDYWKQTPLPTREMLLQALPEGVVDPGGSVSGFVYLEKVPPEIEDVEFRFELTSASSGERFGMMTIPFIVNGD